MWNTQMKYQFNMHPVQCDTYILLISEFEMFNRGAYNCMNEPTMDLQ